MVVCSPVSREEVLPTEWDLATNVAAGRYYITGFVVVSTLAAEASIAGAVPGGGVRIADAAFVHRKGIIVGQRKVMANRMHFGANPSGRIPNREFDHRLVMAVRSRVDKRFAQGKEMGICGAGDPSGHGIIGRSCRSALCYWYYAIGNREPCQRRTLHNVSLAIGPYSSGSNLVCLVVRQGKEILCLLLLVLLGFRQHCCFFLLLNAVGLGSFIFSLSFSCFSSYSLGSFGGGL